MGFERRQSRILIVDDSAFNISILGEALGDEYQIAVAKSGEEALRLAEQEPIPDLILLDIIMPGMDGHKVCRELKSRPATQGIPVIFITAMDQEGDETRGLELGAVDYITKPFSIPIVKARVKTHLELKHKTDILEHLSSLDGLTGIANRRRFDEVLELEWRRSRRTGLSLGIIMLDIDSFKNYNDHYGHGAGDECLRTVAKTLEESLHRPHDFVARYGGEEFVVILPDTDLQGGETIASAMRDKVNSLKITHDFSSAGPYVTCSFGLAVTVPGVGRTAEQLVAAADRMLYKAKQNGRDRIEITDVAVDK